MRLTTDAARAEWAAWSGLTREERAARQQAGPRSPAPEPGGRARVGLLCPGLDVGGAAAWQLALARYCDASQVAWMGCCCVAEGEPSMALRGEMAASMPVSAGAGAAHELAGRCDVLVSWAVEGLENLTVGLRPGPKVLGVAHSPAGCRWAVDHYGRCSGVDAWVAVSESARAGLPEGVRDSARVIGNCVDTARLRPTRPVEATRAAWGVPPGSLVCGYYGRISPEKGPGVMLEVARALPRPWHVVAVGPDWMPHLKDRGRDLPNLHWAGADQRAGDVLRAFDVLCVPSDFESWCLTIAEAVEVGTPVVATPVGLAAEVPGLTRVVAHGATGEAWAAQVEAAAWGGRPRGQLAAIAAARPTWTPDAFGRAWTDLFCEAAR